MRWRSSIALIVFWAIRWPHLVWLVKIGQMADQKFRPVGNLYRAAQAIEAEPFIRVLPVVLRYQIHALLCVKQHIKQDAPLRAEQAGGSGNAFLAVLFGRSADHLKNLPDYRLADR